MLIYFCKYTIIQSLIYLKEKMELFQKLPHGEGHIQSNCDYKNSDKAPSIQNDFHPIDNFDDIYTNVVD